MKERIDSHQHFWDIGRLEYSWMDPADPILYRNYLPEDLTPILDEVGIDRTVLVQAHHSLDETRWLLDIADAHDCVAGVVAWVDLTDPSLDDLLAEFTNRRKLVGVRHVVHDEPDVDWQVRDDVLRGLEALERRGYAYDLLFRPQHLRHVTTLATRFPELRLVIDHLAKPLIHAGRQDGWIEGLRVAASFENVHCKLSGMVTEADHGSWTSADLQPYVERVVELFGFERLMFGSDWPVCLLAGSYSRVHSALVECLGTISDAERDLVFGESATRFYKLPKKGES